MSRTSLWVHNHQIATQITASSLASHQIPFSACDGNKTQLTRYLIEHAGLFLCNVVYSRCDVSSEMFQTYFIQHHIQKDCNINIDCHEKLFPPGISNNLDSIKKTNCLSVVLLTVKWQVKPQAGQKLRSSTNWSWPLHVFQYCSWKSLTTPKMLKEKTITGQYLVSPTNTIFL